MPLTKLPIHFRNAREVQNISVPEALLYPIHIPSLLSWCSPNDSLIVLHHILIYPNPQLCGTGCHIPRLCWYWLSSLGFSGLLLLRAWYRLSPSVVIIQPTVFKLSLDEHQLVNQVHRMKTRATGTVYSPVYFSCILKM